MRAEQLHTGKAYMAILSVVVVTATCLCFNNYSDVVAYMFSVLSVTQGEGSANKKVLFINTTPFYCTDE